jgi:hypothetical protein
MDPVQRKRAGLVGLFIALAGVITVAVAGHHAYSIYNILKTWTPVEAQLVDTAINNDRSFRRIQLARTEPYRVTWTFRYNVGGYTHLGIADPGTHGSHNEMLRWSRRFHLGQTVTIRHQPDDPDVISAAQWDWMTFAHSVQLGCWGIGITGLGLLLRFLAGRASFYSYRIRT